MLDGHDLDEDRLQQLRSDPVAFVEEVFGESPYNYQKRFLRADRRNRCFVAGRQVGKTTTLCWYAIWRFATSRDRDILFFAPSQRQAKNLFDTRLKSVMSEWLENPEAYGITYEAKQEIHGANGCRMVAMTAAGSGDTVRGFTADTVIVDEAAFIEDEFFTSVLKPMLMTTQGDFILAGTPWGQSGYFYNKYHNERWASIQVSTPENPDIPHSEIEEMREDLSVHEFKREVLGEFIAKENAAFPPEAIKDCTYRGENPDDRYPAFSSGAGCYLGVDPARHGTDRAVFVSIDGDGNVFDVDSFEDTSLTEIEGEVRRLNNERGYMQIFIDETGVGGGPLDSLKTDLRNVSGLEFTLKSKQEIYQTLAKHLEDRALTLPDVRWQIGELRDMEYETTPRGHMKYHAADNGRDDFADALALAVWALRDGRTAERSTSMVSMSGSRPVRGGSRNRRY